MPTIATGAGDFHGDSSKARRWFDHARTMASSGNSGYALVCYSHGLSNDPSDLVVHEELYRLTSAALRPDGDYMKTVARGLDRRHPIAGFVVAEVEWLVQRGSAALATQAIVAATGADMQSWIHQFGERLCDTLCSDPSASRAALLAAAERLEEAGADGLAARVRRSAASRRFRS